MFCFRRKVLTLCETLQLQTINNKRNLFATYPPFLCFWHQFSHIFRIEIKSCHFRHQQLYMFHSYQQFSYDLYRRSALLKIRKKLLNNWHKKQIKKKCRKQVRPIIIFSFRTQSYGYLNPRVARVWCMWQIKRIWWLEVECGIRK